MKYILRLLFIYLILSAAASFGAGFFLVKPPDLPYGGASAYRVAGSFLIFIEFLPAILCAGFLCGAANAFGKRDRAYILRLSPSIVKAFQETIVCVVLCTGILFGAEEIGRPLFRRIQEQKISRNARLTEYIGLTKKYLAGEEYFLAEKYILKAQEIAPENPEVQDLFARAEYETADSRRTQAARPAEDGPPAISLEGGAYTSFDLVRMAEDAYGRGAWFDAHFYAWAVLESTSERDPNYARAKRLASLAWNRLSSPEPFTDKEAGALFAKKREGYSALMEKNYLRAYYLFTDLQRDHPNDPDVAHYLNIAFQRTRDRYFFLDELPDLELFNNLDTVYFSYRRPDGGRDMVFIKGMVPVKGTGGAVLFLRNLSVSSYDSSGELERAFTAPFAKVFAQPVSDLDSDTRNALGGALRGKSVAYVMLEGVDPATEGKAVRPTFIFPENSAEGAPSFIFLGLPYEDLLLIVDCTRTSVPLYSLFQFLPLAPVYGFSAEVYMHELYTRIARPLVFAVILMAAALIAWHFRMAQTSTFFKLFWIFVPPGVTCIAYPVIGAVQFAVGAAIYSLTGLGSALCLGTILAAFAVAFGISAIALISRRSTRG
ncbi:MAG: hypothetical protein LBR23_05845 [Spirochaetaceae bacterium]|nr:hypothetical protein [Spirochaetaceae bacterium]